MDWVQARHRSAIAVAESLMSNKKVYVLLPKSLRMNFINEIRDFGEAVYTKDQHWEEKKVRTEEDRDMHDRSESVKSIWIRMGGTL
jgi:hypothetical protein